MVDFSEQFINNLFKFQTFKFNCKSICTLLFSDLYPPTASSKDKIDLNAICIFRGESGVGFRVSRLNHSCDPNVLPWVIDGTYVTVIYSKRPIKAGEEILISYVSIWSQRSEDEQKLKDFMALVSFNLWFKWGIDCPADCICHDNSSVLSVLQKVSRLNKIAFKSGSEGDFETSLAASKETIQLCNTEPLMMGHLEAKFCCLYDAFSAANFLKGRRGEAMGYIKEVNEIIALLDYPGSFKSNRFRGYEESPWTNNKTLVKGKFKSMFEDMMSH